jgi:ribosomal protein L37E
MKKTKEIKEPKIRMGGCEVCGQYPYFKDSGMCGPCTFGTADALGEGDVFGPEDERGNGR